MPSKKVRPANAVLMGDVVRSENASSVEYLHQEFNMAIDHANRRHEAEIVSPLTITLGDEFQGLTTNLRSAAVIARDVRLRLMIKEIECRFVIGSVELRTRINYDRAWNMMGPGFARARGKLNEKRPENLYRFSLDQGSTTETLLEAVGTGLTSIERRWTATQLHDIAESLDGKSAAEIAKMRNVSAHSVYKARGAGDFDIYLLQWHALLETLGALDSDDRAQ